MKNIFIKIGFALLLFQTIHLQAQDATASPPSWWDSMSPSDQMTLILGIIVLLIVFYALWMMDHSVKVIARELRKGYYKERGLDFEAMEAQEAAEKAAQPTIWQKLNDAVPIKEEQEILFEHSYDGIRELDNKLPPWWVGMFYASIIFAVFYVGHYHFGGTGKLQKAEYQAEMERAAAAQRAYLAKSTNFVDESNVTLLVDAASLKKGTSIYNTYCASCHGQFGEGGTGPNFSDQYWLHGGNIEDIFKTVKYGVTEKGMISWKSQLKPVEIQQVASYIYQFEGTNPPSPKAPQGELFIREGGGAEQDSTLVEPTDSTLQTSLIK